MSIKQGKEVENILTKWSRILGIEPPKTHRIRRAQVLNLYKRPYNLCGYCEADDTLYYHNKLDEVSILHELLHKRFPNIGEKDIRTITKLLLKMEEE